ncbi:hypothetical protein [Kitasatospora sp. NPDC094016]|uniref:hypothetical protein n=1 Tax=Kitasatospora sp. NPDC094016 TaxID=3154986 RepID=UPI0033179513
MTSKHSLNTRLLQRALRLYPASYGAGALAEVADLARHRIARSGSAAGLREVADVAGHGARLQLGMVSHRPPGRAFATAAPLAALLAGTYAATYLWRDLRLAISPESADFPAGVPAGGALLAVMSLLVPAVLTACAAAAGRWPAARALALVSLVLAPLFYAMCRFGLCDLDFRTAAELGLGIRGFGLIELNTLVLLAAPPDRTRRTGAGLWLVTAAATAFGIGVTITGESTARILTSGFGIWAPLATGVALALTTRTAGNAALAAAVLAAPPVLTPVLLGGQASVAAMLPQLLVPAAFGYLTARIAILLIARLPRTGRLSRP